MPASFCKETDIIQYSPERQCLRTLDQEGSDGYTTVRQAFVLRNNFADKEGFAGQLGLREDSVTNASQRWENQRYPSPAETEGTNEADALQ